MCSRYQILLDTLGIPPAAGNKCLHDNNSVYMFGTLSTDASSAPAVSLVPNTALSLRISAFAAASASPASLASSSAFSAAAWHTYHRHDNSRKVDQRLALKAHGQPGRRDAFTIVLQSAPPTTHIILTSSPSCCPPEGDPRKRHAVLNIRMCNNMPQGENSPGQLSNMRWR